MFASNNTWHGIISNNWPYSRIPPTHKMMLQRNQVDIHFIKLQENQWHFLKGIDESVEKCLLSKKESCHSMFHFKAHELNPGYGIFSS